MNAHLTALAFYASAALFEILGCYAVWAWAKQGRSLMWLIPGIAALAIFAWLLTRVDTDIAGRAYAAYGGIYILASLAWMWGIEGQRPNLWDATGAGLACLGAVVILVGALRA